MTLVLTVILVALIFEYINGFHDTANSIATVVSTKVLTPRQAVVLAALTNLVGALWGTAVAKTISSGLVDSKLITMSSEIIVCALLGAIIWNLITWWFGLPSSSSHALIGGLCGAALAASGNNWKVLIWSQPSTEHWWLGKGLLWKVIVPMVTSPLGGFLLGFVIMAALYLLLHNYRPQRVNRFFGVAQIVSAGSMGFMHGTNDAQKTMGIIALTLMGATAAGTFNEIPSWMRFLYTPQPSQAVYASMNQVGVMYRDGKGVHANDEAAEKWFRRAADKNNADAMENLALLIQAGRSRAGNAQEAESLIQRAAKIRKGSAADPLHLLTPSLTGAPSDESAWSWYQQHADKGNADAQAYVGLAYLQGNNVPQNIPTALEWLHKAANHHNTEASFALGVLHSQGRNVPQDDARAFAYFHGAAEREGIKAWIKVICALTMAAGTAAGGWRIIKTLGHKMVKLHPINGFAAEASSATVIGLASTLGIPVSTTHNISAAIMGVGSAKRFNAIKWSVVERMLWAWVLTIPVSGGIAYLLVRLFNALGWKP